MGAEGPAFPTIDKTTRGFSKREAAAKDILCAYIAAGTPAIPPLKDIIELADKLIKKCQAVPYE